MSEHKKSAAAKKDEAVNKEEQIKAEEASPAGETSFSGTAVEQNKETEEILVKVKELEEENSVLKDKYLRKQAEYENFRKRMIKDKEDAVKYANSSLLLDLVTVIDDFERAIKSSETSRDFSNFYDGIVMIEKQLVGSLERKWGLKRFESKGEKFDPEKHEAIGSEERDDVEEQLIIEDYVKGFYLNDRVIRPAKVKVAVKKEA